ncbi:MAG: hypothetical protein KGJ86_07095 [Chloroflexota bacterium]|nr:hypothetical protein [Chloroflexota bacterium]
MSAKKFKLKLRGPGTIVAALEELLRKHRADDEFRDVERFLQVALPCSLVR